MTANRAPTADEAANSHLNQAPSKGGQVLSYSGTQATSTTLATGLHRISATSDCWYIVGLTGVAAEKAVANNAFLGAGAIDYITIKDVLNSFLRVIQEDTAGVMSVTDATP